MQAGLPVKTPGVLRADDSRTESETAGTFSEQDIHICLTHALVDKSQRINTLDLTLEFSHLDTGSDDRRSSSPRHGDTS